MVNCPPKDLHLDTNLVPNLALTVQEHASVRPKKKLFEYSPATPAPLPSSMTMKVLDDSAACSTQCQPPSQKSQDMSRQYDGDVDHGQQYRLNLKPLLDTAAHTSHWGTGPTKGPTGIAGPPDDGATLDLYINNLGHQTRIDPKIVVIKNIPVTIKKDQLAKHLRMMGLPCPIKFNYNYEKRLFTGIAFADFESCVEATKFMDAVNDMELAGRKLRAENKRILPATELDRVRHKKWERQEQERRERQEQEKWKRQEQERREQQEREKWERQEQQKKEQQQRWERQEQHESGSIADTLNMDMNNPVILGWYARLVAFSADKTQGEIVFLGATHEDRVCIYRLAEFVGLADQVRDFGNGGTIEFQKIRQPHRRAGTGFSDSPVLESYSNDLTTSHNLRPAKSFTQGFDQKSRRDSSNSLFGNRRKNGISIDQLTGQHPYYY